MTMFSAYLLGFHRQNRMERRNQKKWSHIQSELIAQLDDKERSLISLRVKHLMLSLPMTFHFFLTGFLSLGLKSDKIMVSENAHCV